MNKTFSSHSSLQFWLIIFYWLPFNNFYACFYNLYRLIYFCMTFTWCFRKRRQKSCLKPVDYTQKWNFWHLFKIKIHDDCCTRLAWQTSEFCCCFECPAGNTCQYTICPEWMWTTKMLTICAFFHMHNGLKNGIIVLQFWGFCGILVRP